MGKDFERIVPTWMDLSLEEYCKMTEKWVVNNSNEKIEGEEKKMELIKGDIDPECKCDPDEIGVVCEHCVGKMIEVGERRMKDRKVNPYEISKKLIIDRQLSGNRMGIDDKLTNTNLISKNYSPMFIRKFNASCLSNWPLYVSMICDEDVSDIDSVVNGALRAFEEKGLIGNNLQSMRNLTGIISETISKYYNAKKENCVEGIAITLYIDKAYIQNFTGDYMNHAQCRSEYTSALLMMTQI